ncbi:hypothetical protein JRQ81_010307 [Phrynocephalus forsythii]|uniref:Uncharacterized protein n=1 Tax=Phrynocephalus forsythii TaxID=171643 RepID=A0A9Q0X891_9SAUR|nr:hypothetical protein JRQ81_010307 [Phrynocephalus forsythii]
MLPWGPGGKSSRARNRDPVAERIHRLEAPPGWAPGARLRAACAPPDTPPDPLPPSLPEAGLLARRGGAPAQAGGGAAAGQGESQAGKREAAREAPPAIRAAPGERLLDRLPDAMLAFQRSTGCELSP